MNGNEELMHYGTPRHSGRYPWGSGENPYQHDSNFYRQVKKMMAEGKTDDEMADFFNMTKSEFKDRKSVSRSKEWNANARMAMHLKDKGYSNVEIGKRLGCGESQVRNYLNKDKQEREAVIFATAEMLKKQVAEKGLIDVGAGAEIDIGVSEDRLKKALYSLQEDGYEVYGDIRLPQIQNKKQNTILRVLCPPGTTHTEVYKNRTSIQSLTPYSNDGGKTFEDTQFPESLNSDRIMIRYADEGGKAKDGTIEIRKGVKDLDLGENCHYSQVRIAVDNKLYLKGVAMYGNDDDFPPGVDVIFNTRHNTGATKEEVFKELKIDKATGEVDQLLPFGSTIKRGGQSYYADPNGKYTDPDTGEKCSLSLINKVNEEGDWNTWGKTVASQFLSKQPEKLIRQQLQVSYDDKAEEFEQIKAITNGTVKRKLLLDFAEDCDASAVHLKAVGFPRQRQQVILPVPDIPENQVYAPNFKNGEEVILIRYPHQGVFEIPRLIVNNDNKSGKNILGQAQDAIGINPKVAQQLSGADFDGDTVTVIPVGKNTFHTELYLEGLKNFDADREYPAYPGMKILSKEQTQTEMGKISNLITDMTLKGATEAELTRAVKHSMVIIDATKHKLDYQSSYEDQGIAELKEKYQKKSNGKSGGASTLISQAKATVYNIPEKAQWYAKAATKDSPSGIDPETGEKLYSESGRKYVDKKTGELKVATTTSTKMAEAKDAHELSSGTIQENIYADYANNLKALGNEARKLYLNTKEIEKNPSAQKTYAKEIEELEKAVKISQTNAPRERQAQVIANYIYNTKVQDNPEIAEDNKLDKKVRSRALEEARAQVGAKKQRVEISEKQWEAIQAGAIGSTALKTLLNNADMDIVKKYAMPRDYESNLSDASVARLKTYFQRGYTYDEIAERLGVSVTTVQKQLKEANLIK